jgi:glycosyltransferase involved in cell wall biosynthesis
VNVKEQGQIHYFIENYKVQKENIPKVSVCVITFNQEKYIHQCLQSIVDQRTTFDFEVIVGDDCSTDGTREIVRNFALKYPKIIKPIFHEKNIGGNKNYFSVHNSTLGKYVAHIDGDDYALPNKLQKQVEILDKNRHINILWHRMIFMNTEGKTKVHPEIKAPYLNQIISRADLMLYGPFGQHSSTMYRKNNCNIRNGSDYSIDWLFSVELIQDGKGLMLEDVLGVYRLHSFGITKGAIANRKVRELICACQLELIKKFPEYKSLISLRALFMTLLDFISLRKYFYLSLIVLIETKAMPKLTSTLKLIKFYQFSKLPNCFK